MNALFSPPVFLIVAALYCGEISANSGPYATQAVAADALPLEKVAERLRKIDDDYAKQADAFVAVVDAEVAARRIGNTVAQLLSILARAEQTSWQFEAIPLIKNIPQDNAAISAASKDLGIARKLHQARMKALFAGLSIELLPRVKDALLGRPKPAEITALMQTLQGIQDVWKQRVSDDGLVFELEDFTGVLGVAKQLTEAENDPSTLVLTVVVEALRNNAASFSSLITRDESNARIARITQSIRKNAEEQSIAIEAMIEAHKPLQEITISISAYAKTVKQLKALNPDQTLPDDDTVFYTNILIALESLEKGDYQEMNRRLGGAIIWSREHKGSRDVLRCAKREQMVNNIQKNDHLKNPAKLYEQIKTDILARIPTVKEASDIAAIVDEFRERLEQMSKIDQSFGDARKYQMDIGGLINTLKDIRSGISYISNLKRISRQEFETGRLTRQSPAVYLEATTALSNRFLRVAYAKTLQASELSTAPYTDKDPEAAVEALCDDLAKRGEWQRLLDVLRLRPKSHGQQETDPLAAIHSYLEGKNFELAEQWTDAVLAFKAVLRSTDQRAPIQAATESIKAIAKAHPEAITEAENLKKSGTNANSVQMNPPPL